MDKVQKIMALVFVAVFLVISQNAFCGGLPNGWEGYEKNKGNFEFGFDDTESAYYVESIKTNEARGILKRKISVSAFKGSKIKLTALVKTKETKGPVYLYADSNVKKGGNHVKVTDASNWRSFDVILVVPNNLTSISYGVSLFGEGKVWIKDLQMTLFLD